MAHQEFLLAVSDEVSRPDSAAVTVRVAHARLDPRRSWRYAASKARRIAPRRDSRAAFGG
jgi:hypothetical protein